MRYPAWKYLLILVVLTISTLYALPSLYPDEPAVQISGAKAGTQIDQSIVQKAEQILKTENNRPGEHPNRRRARPDCRLTTGIVREFYPDNCKVEWSAFVRNVRGGRVRAAPFD